jgi:bifunctional UDP-N-acetylglucosamine pyrophosphorylase / glucosamine-1-phosphate N-acetyltransferase
MLCNIQAIVLAAGQARRFKTEKTKLVEPLCGQELILYSTRLLASLTIPTTVVVGYQKENIINLIKQHHNDTITVAHQQLQQGTGDALACSHEYWQQDYVLVLNGDTPLISDADIITLYEQHLRTKATISFVTAYYDVPSSSYGRVINDTHGIRIVEAREFEQEAQEYPFINAGIYLINKSFLVSAIQQLTRNHTSKEFYITDLIHAASSAGHTVTTVALPFDHIRGINTLEELWVAEHIKRSELIRYWMEQGVRFMAPHTTHIDVQVKIGAGSHIGADAHLFGATTIGKQCHIAPFCLIDNSTIEDNSTVHGFSVLRAAHIARNCNIGPFAHIQDSSIGSQSIVGNFVETKRTTIGLGTKAKHHSYLGDATIGNQVNIGAGTITCNHNGIRKHATTIADNAYIGTHTSLVAPVTVGTGAFTAAGSVITHDVPADALAFGRARQVNKVGYAKQLRKQPDAADHVLPTQETEVSTAHSTSPKAQKPIDSLMM